jgi:hypothetical protein
MKIKCDNGLCDRLRFIFSYFFKFNKKKLIVCWKINKKCNGHFLDLFEPIKNLEFTEDESDVDVCDWKPFFDFKATKSNIYKDLTLLPELQEQIRQTRNKTGKYLAIHVRRTDKKINRINRTNLTPDDDFIKFINNNNKNYKIFLATDCFYVQNKFKEKFQERLFWTEKIKKPWNYTLEDCETYDNNAHAHTDFRPTSLKSTAIDLFTCIYSNKFMGTNLSSMSDFIYYNKEIRKKIFI